jgi:hypothetical protein
MKMSILARSLVFLLFLLIGGAPIAASTASDPVIYFNTRKYWGNIDIGYFGYNQKNEIIFLGRYYKKRKITYSYNIDGQQFGNTSKEDREYPNGEVGLEDLDSYYKWKIDEFGIKIIGTVDDLYLYTDLSRGAKISSFDNAWIALNLDNKEHLISKRYDDLGEIELSTHFRYLDDANIKISPAGDLYVFPQSHTFFYKIPMYMRGKIIVRERLVYAPIRYLLHIWNKIPECENKKIYSDNYDSDYYEDACLVSFFNSLTKGDYDADSFELITPR